MPHVCDLIFTNLFNVINRQLGCGHCKKLAPEFSKAGEALQSQKSPVKLGKVDATTEPELASRFGVQGYPTLKIFRHGQESEYKGPREAPGIISYMKKQSQPVISDMTTAEALKEFLAADSHAIVFYGPASHSLYSIFKTVASTDLREDFRFGHVSSEAVQKASGFEGQIVFHQDARYAQSKLEKATVSFTGLTRDQLQRFVEDNALPLAGEITEDNMKFYARKGLPVLKLFSKVDWKLNPKDIHYFLNRLRKLATDYSGKMLFAIASNAAFSQDIADTGMSSLKAPFMIHDLRNEKRYVSKKEFSLEDAKTFIDSVLAGKVEPYVKSEEIPTSDEGPVKVVVGKSFSDVVMRPGKDVLLEVYAPWCGHCKTLEPKYKELAEKLKHNKDLIIAKIDGTANDLPPQFHTNGFPTIFFVPADKSRAPMTYEGGREVKDFIKYLQTNAVNPVSEKDAGKSEL